MKPKVGFDLDGVLYEWQVVAYEYLVENKLTKAPFNEFWISEVKTLNPIARDNLLNLEFLYNKLNLKPKLLKFLDSYKGRLNVYYITNRPERMLHITDKWLRDSKLPQPENLYLNKGDKSTLVRELELDVFVEDRQELIDPLKHLCKCFLVDKPWNETYSSPYVTRINDITEIGDYLCELLA